VTSRSPWLVVVLIALALMLPASPADAATEIPVLTSPAGEFQPARSESALAWEQNTRARPNQYSVMIRPDGGSVVQANRAGTSAAMGDFAGSRLVYQQYRGNPYGRGRSDLFFFDPSSGQRSKVPGVNSRQWEYWPSSSGAWLLFARWKPKNEVRRLFLHNLDTGERRLLEKTKGKKAFIGPGQVNGGFAVWSTCRPRCEVVRYDIGTRSKETIANPGFYQRAPSVTSGGTVYFSRGGKGCGQSVALVRAQPDGSQEVLVQLQQGLDIRDTYAYTEPEGSTEIYYERNACSAKAGSDIYKVLDPETAGVKVTHIGTGTGSVTSSPAGINCGTDCTHDFPGGSTVTLQAVADPGSYFAGWGGACSGTGECVLQVDGTQNVSALFEQTGTIVIVKDALPDGPDDFAFTSTGGLVPPTFNLDDDDNPTLPNSRTFSALRAGAYTVAESNPPAGWLRAGVLCIEDGAQNTTTGQTLAALFLEPGETIECTFSNARQGSITIAKDAIPDDGQDFRFDPSSNIQTADFFLDDDGDPDADNSNTQTFSGLPTGATYSVLEESIPAGWELTDLECLGGGANTSADLDSATVTIGLDPGEAVLCTFTDTKASSIRIVKDALPNHPQNFSFTTTGGLSPPSFSLDDDADGTLPNQLLFSGLEDGTYSVIEDANPPGWQLTDIDCAGGGSDTFDTGRTATIGLDPGESVVCTFQNTEEGSITVVKDAVPDDPQDFSFTTTGGLSPSGFSLDDDTDGALSSQLAFTGLLPGTFSVTEGANPLGWQLTDITCTGGGPNTTDTGRTATIGLDPGENVICTFENTQGSSITVVKDAVPDDPQDFRFDPSSNLQTADFFLDDDSDPDLPSQEVFTGVATGQTYTVLEENIPADWTLTDINCSGGGPNTSTNVATATATIGLDPGESVVCTFQNTEEGSITVVKDAVPDDPQDFSFTTTGGLSPSEFSLDEDADGALSNQQQFTDLLPGTFSVTEGANPPGWQLTDITCTGGGPNTTDTGGTATIGLDAGENVTCTFTNQGIGSITISQDTVPDDSQDFGFTTSGGLSPSSFTLDDDADPLLSNQQIFTQVEAGNYTVDQTPVLLWPFSSLICTGGGGNTSTLGSTASIGLDPGENVSCTYQNAPLVP
jgi:Divergent InlB B-repeat domain